MVHRKKKGTRRFDTKQTFQLGGQVVSKEEFALARTKSGSSSGGGAGVSEERRKEIGGIVKQKELAGRIGQQQGQPVSIQQVPEIQQEQAGQLSEAGAFEEVTPQKPGLATDLATDIPIVSAALGGISQVVPQEIGVAARVQAPIITSVLSIARKFGWLDDVFPEKIKGKEAFPIPETPETLREASLRQISIDSFDKGVSRGEAFGTFIEALPGIGNRARKWADGLIEQPSPNAEVVLGHIASIKEAASTGQEKVRNGLEDPAFGLDRAREMEEDIADLTGRLKLLIESSAVLKANTDLVNSMEEDILEAQEKVSRYRTASTFGLTAELTGTGRIIPSDEVLFYELKRINEEK